MGNIAVLVDYDNVYLTMVEAYGADPLGGDVKSNVFLSLKKRWKEIASFKAYADFDKIGPKNASTLLQMMDIDPVTVFSTNGTITNRKNASDIELSMDAIELAIRNSDITHYVLVSADSDMIPVTRRLRKLGKHVTIVYLRASCNETLVTSFPDESLAIEDLLGLQPVPVLNADELDKYGSLLIKQLDYFDRQNQADPNRYIGTSWLKRHLVFVRPLSTERKFSTANIDQLLEWAKGIDAIRIDESSKARKILLDRLAPRVKAILG